MFVASANIMSIVKKNSPLQAVTANFHGWPTIGSFITGRPARSAAIPVLFLYSVVQKWVFRPAGPQGRHVAPINMKFDKVRSPVPNFTFIGAEMWGYSPKTIKISNFGHKFSS